MASRPHSRQKSMSSTGSNLRSLKLQPPTANQNSGNDVLVETLFEPCAATGSLFLYAEASSVICLHHDTLALERRFEKHTENIQFICVDNVSERGQGRLVVTYDIGHTAIVWDLMTGEQVSRFASYEPLTAAAWMRNGNLTFGNEKGELILFEPATSEHISARTIFDPLTAIAPSSDCKTFALGYRNGSILLANLQPNFTILHTLSTARAPSQISALSWHASSSKQKSDMLATNTTDGDLRVWSVAKPPNSSQPRIIRTLHRSDTFSPSKSWICWSKNGKILQLYDGVTWAWDVRTKDVTYQSIPTVEFVRGIAAYGPTGTLFTMGPNNTIQQYDVDVPQMVANVRHQSRIPPVPSQAVSKPQQRSGSESDYMSPRRDFKYSTESTQIDSLRRQTPQSGHRRSNSYGKLPLEQRGYDPAYSARKTERTATTISLGAQSSVPENPYSPSSTKSARRINKSVQEGLRSPQEETAFELFPFTRARLSDVPYQQPNSPENNNLTPDGLRKQMLSVVFGWQDDIRSMISDELSQHPEDSPNAVFLTRWLGSEPNQVANVFRSTPADPALDWMRLALNSIGAEPSTKKMAQVFTQKLLSQGEVHAAVCLLMAIGDFNDAIEIYVSRHFHMEAILLTCLLMPLDWQRQSYLVRNWGDELLQNPQRHTDRQSQRHLAVRCFSCTNAEPTEPWTSPTVQTAAQSLKDIPPLLQPSIYHKTMERRGLQEPSPQTGSTPAVNFPTNSRQTPEDGGLKLITSFEGKEDFKFPGLMSEEGTPINMAFITPIAESALPRSAISPGPANAFGRANSSRSGSLASRTGTPGIMHRNRLPSIGEAPADAEASPQLSGPAVRATSVSAESSRNDPSAKLARSFESNGDAQALAPLLLTPARYDPKAPNKSETPQTAVAPRSVSSFGDDRPVEITRPASARPHAQSRTHKAGALSVQTQPLNDPQPGVELLLPYAYGEPIPRPATTTAAFRTQRSDFMSPPNTGNSLKSLKSPSSVSGRSLDQYISSLEQAQYYHSSRSRGNSITSKQSRDEHAGKKYSYHSVEDEDHHESNSVTPVPAVKRSPSSPVPMSPEELRLHTASVESFDSAYLSATSHPTRIGSTVSMGPESQRQGTTADASRRRHRAQSNTEDRAHSRTRGTSRRRSRDREAGPRGRSNSRKESSATRSPESPIPMIPSEEDLRGAHSVDPALKFVARNRHRLNRSSRDSSSDRKTPQKRSRSKQHESYDRGHSRKSSISLRSERSYRSERSARQHVSHDTQSESASVVLDGVSSASEADRMSFKNLRHIPHSRRKELAQAELEARRQSLVRRPSAPAVPLPGHNMSSTSTLDHAPPLFRSQTDQGPLTLSSISAANLTRPDSAGFGRSRPQTPRAMKHPAHGQKSAADIPNVDEVLSSSIIHLPSLPDTSVMTAKKNSRSSSFTSPEVPFDMPKHPAFNSTIATSRVNGQNALNRAKSPPIVSSRETRSYAEPIVTIGEEDDTNGEVVYASASAMIPELQHLAIPPPPPPPPPVAPQGLRIHGDHPSITTTMQLSNPASSLDPNDKQFSGKFRNLVGSRIRSQSRGRSQSRARDNTSRSPNVGVEDSVSPYESIQPLHQAQYHLTSVSQGR